MVRAALAVTAAALLARVLWPPALPAVICLLGITRGGETGAACGLFGGILALCLGFSPWQIPLLTLLGGISGGVFHHSPQGWGNCLRALPLLAGYGLLSALGHWLTGEDLLACLVLAGKEFLRTALTLPVLYPFCLKRRSP